MVARVLSALCLVAVLIGAVPAAAWASAPPAAPAARILQVPYRSQLDRAWRNSDFPYAAVALADPAGRPRVNPLPPVDTAAPPIVPLRRFLGAI